MFGRSQVSLQGIQLQKKINRFGRHSMKPFHEASATFRKILVCARIYLLKSTSAILLPNHCDHILSMGVEVQKISPGNGEYPKKGQTVSVHYVGTLQNGKEFDSSRKRGQPLDFKLGQGQVIKAWDEGIIQLSKGERAKLTCSPDYAYGSQGVGNGVSEFHARRNACDECACNTEN